MSEPQKIRMFSKIQVSLATFIGAPIAGALLISKNYTAKGQANTARQSLVIGIIGTVIVLVVAFLMTAKIPHMVVPLASLFAVQMWYQQTQEATFKSHVAEGGMKGSWGYTVGTGVLCLFMLLAIMFVLAMLLPERYPRHLNSLAPPITVERVRVPISAPYFDVP